MKTQIFTTVGTSLFTNFMEQNKQDINALLNVLEDLPFTDNNWEDEAGRINELKRRIGPWIENNANAAAEIISTLKIMEQLQKDCLVRLIATDTILSCLAAELISAELKGKTINGHTIEVIFHREQDSIKNLQIKDSKRFERDGLRQLIDYVNQYLDSTNGVLNITGGYKGVIPYFSLIGMIKNVPLYYIFENTDDLIKIPPIPIEFNWGVIEKHANMLAELNEGIENWSQYKSQNNIDAEINACIWESKEDDMALLSAIGEILWQHYQQFIRIKIPKGSFFFADQPGNQRQVENAIQGLYNRLTDIITHNQINSQEDLLAYINRLSKNNDLRHATNPGKHLFIYKDTNKDHVRLVYRPLLSQGGLSLLVLDYVRGAEIHEISARNGDDYIETFKKKWSNFKDGQINDFITRTIKKQTLETDKQKEGY